MVPFSSPIQSVSSMWPSAGGEHRKLKELRPPKWVLRLLPNLNPNLSMHDRIQLWPQPPMFQSSTATIPNYPSLKFIMDCVLIFLYSLSAPVPFPEFEQEYSYSNWTARWIVVTVFCSEKRSRRRMGCRGGGQMGEAEGYDGQCTNHVMALKHVVALSLTNHTWSTCKVKYWCKYGKSRHANYCTNHYRIFPKIKANWTFNFLITVFLVSMLKKTQN